MSIRYPKKELFKDRQIDKQTERRTVKNNDNQTNKLTNLEKDGNITKQEFSYNDDIYGNTCKSKKTSIKN